MTPCTTFVNGINPFPFFAPIAPVKKARITNLWGVSAKRIFDTICTHPGVTASDLIGITGNTAAGEYAKLLLEAGEIEFDMQRTAPHQRKAGVRHYYPKGHLCNRPAPRSQRGRAINDAQAIEIRAFRALMEPYKSIARRYRVGVSTIENVVGCKGVYKNELSN